MSHNEHADVEHFNWADHIDEPHANWTDHDDRAHQDESHTDWQNHVDEAHYDFTNAVHGDVPEEWDHYDWGNHGDAPHVDYTDHMDEPHEDWTGHTDEPVHGDWQNFFIHDDWSDHADWDDHGDEPHYDWSDFFNSPHTDEPLHSDWENLVQLHSDWYDTIHTDESHLDHRDHDDEPHVDAGHLDWDNHSDAAHDDFGNHVDVPHEDWTDLWSDAPPPPPLEASLTAEPTEGYPPLEVRFTASWTGGAPPYLVEIDYGDGSLPDSITTSATEAPFAHRYDRPGTYTARVIVTDAQRNSDTATVTITVSQPPTPAPTITSFDVKQVELGSLEVEARIEWSGGEYPVTVKIGWGDGQVDEIPETDPNVHSMTVTHTYRQYGEYVVTAVVVDSLGRVSPGVQKTIVVQAEIELIRWDTRMIGDRHLETEIEFNVEVKRYVLRWGDGGEVTGEPVTPTKVIKEDHVYPWAGQYHLEIEITDVYDRTATYGKDVVVEGLMAESDPFEITGIAAPFMGVVAGTYTARVWVEAGKVFLQLINKGTGRVAVSVEASTVAKTWTDTLANLYRQVIDELVELGASADEINKALDAADRAIKEMAPKIQEAIKFNRGAGIDLLEKLRLSCLLYTSPSPRDLSTSRMPSSA